MVRNEELDGVLMQRDEVPLAMAIRGHRSLADPWRHVSLARCT